MIINGEYGINKVLAMLFDGKTGTSCRICHKLMVRLMPEKYKYVEIMPDYETGKIIK